MTPRTTPRRPWSAPAARRPPPPARANPSETLRLHVNQTCSSNLFIKLFHQTCSPSISGFLLNPSPRLVSARSRHGLSALTRRPSARARHGLRLPLLPAPRRLAVAPAGRAPRPAAGFLQPKSTVPHHTVAAATVCLSTHAAFRPRRRPVASLPWNLPQSLLLSYCTPGCTEGCAIRTNSMIGRGPSPPAQVPVERCPTITDGGGAPLDLGAMTMVYPCLCQRTYLSACKPHAHLSQHPKHTHNPITNTRAPHRQSAPS